jgi:SAM-dependent methyltransferase
MSLLRSVIDGASSVLGKIKKNQRISLPSDVPIKANLGCGLAVAPGWVNIDGSLSALVATLPRWFHSVAYHLTGARNYYKKEEYLGLLSGHRFVHHDLSYGLPIDDGMVDYLYTSHFVEHLFRKDAEHLLEECFRVLKPGGVLRISVPDLEYAVSLYTQGEREKMLANYFFVEDDNSYYARHKYMYDYYLLSNILRNSGFKDISRTEYRQGSTPDIEQLDNRPEESLFVEATR